AATYNHALKDVPLQLPCTRPGILHAYHQYVVNCKRREELRMVLHKQGIETLVHYPMPVHLQPAYRERIIQMGSLKNSEQAADEVLSLPMYAELSTQHAHHVAENILACARTGFSI